MNDATKFQLTLILTVPLGILAVIKPIFFIPLAISLGISIYFINKMEAIEKTIAYFYLIGVIILITPIIFIQNPYTILMTELILYGSLITSKNMLPRKIKVKIIETTKKHSIIEINKSFSHPFPTGLYAIKATKKKGMQIIKWKQKLIGTPELTEFE